MNRFPPAVLALATSVCICTSAAADPERALLRQSELRAGWEVVREAPGKPGADPDLRAWGVDAQHVRHYTRDVAGILQVCSVEIWSFASEAQAEAAHAGFHYPGWEFRRVRRALVMLRGLVRVFGRPETRGVFPECRAIGKRIGERVSGL